MILKNKITGEDVDLYVSAVSANERPMTCLAALQVVTSSGGLDNLKSPTVGLIKSIMMNNYSSRYGSVSVVYDIGLLYAEIFFQQVEINDYSEISKLLLQEIAPMAFEVLGDSPMLRTSLDYMTTIL